MSKIFLYYGIYIFGVFISSISQILLKKSANIKRDRKVKEYLNVRTILAYGMFFIATLCSLFAYKYISLAMGPILGTTEYVLVAILSYYILKEKISKKKLFGLFIIVLGVLIFSL